MKYLAWFILDKILRFVLLFEFSSKKKDDYIYERDFLGKENYAADYAPIFKPVTDLVDNDFNKIYNIKYTQGHEAIFQKIKYCIDHRFWGILEYTASDGFYQSNEEYFSQPSAIVYIVENSAGKTFVLVKSTVKHFEIINHWPGENVGLRPFKEKKLVYSKATNFVSI